MATMNWTKNRPGVTGLAAALLAGTVLLGACGGDNLFSSDAGVVQQSPPLVTAIDAPVRITGGSALDVRIKAVAPRGIESLTVRFRRAINDQKVLTFVARTDTVTADVTILLPLQLADSVLVIEAFATDVGGRVSDISSDTVIVTSGTAFNVSAAPVAAAVDGRGVTARGKAVIVDERRRFLP